MVTLLLTGLSFSGSINPDESESAPARQQGDPVSTRDWTPTASSLESGALDTVSADDDAQDVDDSLVLGVFLLLLIPLSGRLLDISYGKLLKDLIYASALERPG